MKENNKGSMIILTVIGIATLLVAVIGATFAYFTVTIKYEDKPTPAVIQSSTMLVTFKTLNELTYTGAMPGRPSLSDDPIAKTIDNKLSFSLTSATNMTVSTKYNVYLVIDNNDEEGATGDLTANDFTTNNLVYILSQERDITSAATSNGTTGAAGSEYIADDAYVMDDIDGDGPNAERKVGTIKKDLKAGEKQLIATGELGSHGSVDTWEFELWLRETGDVQNEDQGKVLKAHITVEPIDQQPITYEPDKVTTP